MKVELDLSQEEWIELTEAVYSKHLLVERGDYGEVDEEEGFDKDIWAKQLLTIYNKLTAVLDG